MIHLGPTPARPNPNRTSTARRSTPVAPLLRLLVLAVLGVLALAACQLGPSPNAEPSTSGEPTTTDNPQAENPNVLPTEVPLPTDIPLPEVTPTESATPEPEPSDQPSDNPGGSGGQQPPGPVSGTTLFGAAPPMTEFNYDMDAATSDMESKVGPLQVRREYRQWNEPWGYYVPDDKQHNRVSVISVKGPGSAPGSWSKVASGSEDERIRNQASQLASYGSTIYLTFNHEPENDAQDAATFRAASEHFYDVVKSVAPDVQVGPTLMAWTGRGGGNRSVNDWLYSDSKMDFIAWDGYNFNGPNGAGWQTPAQIFDKPMEIARDHGKPALISETGVHGAYNGPQGQTPPQWLQAMVDYANQNGVVLVAYFNTGSRQQQNSVIMTQPMEQVYRDAISASNARR